MIVIVADATTASVRLVRSAFIDLSARVLSSRRIGFTLVYRHIIT